MFKFVKGMTTEKVQDYANKAQPFKTLVICVSCNGEEKVQYRQAHGNGIIDRVDIKFNGHMDADEAFKIRKFLEPNVDNGVDGIIVVSGTNDIIAFSIAKAIGDFYGIDVPDTEDRADYEFDPECYKVTRQTMGVLENEHYLQKNLIF